MQFPTSPDIKQLSHNNFPVRFGTHFLLFILHWRLTLLLPSQCLISFQFMLEIEVVAYNVSHTHTHASNREPGRGPNLKANLPAFWWRAIDEPPPHGIEWNRIAWHRRRKERDRRPPATARAEARAREEDESSKPMLDRRSWSQVKWQTHINGRQQTAKVESEKYCFKCQSVTTHTHTHTAGEDKHTHPRICDADCWKLIDLCCNIQKVSHKDHAESQQRPNPVTLPHVPSPW